MNIVERIECCSHLFTDHDLTVGARRERINEHHVVEDVALRMINKLLPRFGVPGSWMGAIVGVRHWEGQGMRVIVRILENSWDHGRGGRWSDGGVLHGERVDEGHLDGELLGRGNCRRWNGSLGWLDIRGRLTRDRWGIFLPMVLKDISWGVKLWVGVRRGPLETTLGSPGQQQAHLLHLRDPLWAIPQALHRRKSCRQAQ